MPDDPQLDALKLPPHSLEAEQSILGGLLLDNEAADRIGDVVSDDDFYSDAHRVIYRHIVALAGDGKPVDVVTLSEALGSVQKLDYVGGLAYLGALVANVPTAANIRHYAQIVRERSILRQLAATAGEIADAAYNPLGRNARSVLDEAEAKVLHIAEQGSRGQRTYTLLKDLLVGVVDRIETLYNRDDPVGRHGHRDRLHRSRQGDRRAAARRSRHRRRPAVDGQDRARDQHRRARRARAQAAGRRVLDGNGRVAARDAHDRLGRPARPAQAAHRPPRRPTTGRSCPARSAGCPKRRC